MPDAAHAERVALQERAIAAAQELARICHSLEQPEAAELIGDALVILATDLNVRNEIDGARSSQRG